MSKKRDYIVYDADERPVFIGTLDECARYMGLSRSAVERRMTRMKKGLTSRKASYECYIIEEKEDNDD